MTGYGFLIIHALVTDIEPAHKVKEAMVRRRRRWSVANSAVSCGVFRRVRRSFSSVLGAGRKA
jgi:hypothetical protein